MFGILIVQIKPQLEKLLKIPNDSLTKEIQLTQDLMELFIKYQIPSDLLTFDGNESLDQSTKLNAVKEHVARIKEMLNNSRKKELEHEKELKDLELRNKERLKELEARKQREGEEILGMTATRSMVPNPLRNYRTTSRCVDQSYDHGPSFQPTSQSFFQSTASVPPSGNMETRKMPKKGKAAPPPNFSGAKEEYKNLPEKRKQNDSIDNSRKNFYELKEGGSGGYDFTNIPKTMDDKFEEMKSKHTKPTIIEIGKIWKKKSNRSFLREKTENVEIHSEGQRKELNAAFDLLDAISRSGSLSLEESELHVIISTTHNFEESVIDTVIENNINPIEHVEKSLLLVNSVVFQTNTENLLKDDQVDRIKLISNELF
ncbi:hypothetical protein HDU92_001967 [Lobulomyces angularis]|nr:hypothetical protein HDU92_001967 [Lobulomyces angularis]